MFQPKEFARHAIPLACNALAHILKIALSAQEITTFRMANANPNAPPQHMPFLRPSPACLLALIL